MENNELKFDKLYEKFKEKLKSVGNLNDKQINSKAVKVTLETLYDNNEDQYNAFKEKEVIEQLQRRKDYLEQQVAYLESVMKNKEEKYDRFKKSIEKLRGKGWGGYDITEEDCENIDYIADFYDDLKKMESPEMRDRLKVAQLYYHTIKSEFEFQSKDRWGESHSNFDNGTFMITLASLLSGLELHKLKLLKNIHQELN